MKASCIWGSVAGLGLALVVAGIVAGWAVGPSIVESLVHEQMDLTDQETDGYKYFIEPPVPVMVKFTFFEVSNHEEVIAGEKPFLTEKGPYTYQEDMVKKDLKWSNGSDASDDTKQFLEFGQYKTYTFLPDKSCTNCTEDDQVRMLNMPLAGLIAKFVEIGSTTGLIGIGKVEAMLKDGIDELFALTNVGDFLFRGISDGAAGWMMTYVLTKDRLPPVFRPENGFALFNGKQDTSENECYQVETGQEDWEQHTVITKWGKDSASLSEDLSKAETCSWTGAHPQKWWPLPDADGNTGESSTCNQLRGTDGHQFPPFVNKEDQEDLWLFNTVPCRSIFMKYSKKAKIEGISTLEYSVPLDGANINKKINVCTCKELSDLVASNDTCVKTMDDDTLDISDCDITSCYDGLQDISVCQGAPTFLSYPHFYLAKAQQDNFEGLAPDAEAHRTFMNVEPNTGMTLRLHSRVQLNTPVYNSQDLPMTSTITVLTNITTVPAFPILWIDEGADIDSDPEMVKKLKKQLVTPLNILNIGKWTAIGVGMAIFALGGVMTFIKTCGK
eukprot:TRINITY_DN12983_c0_g1_i3.p1 TRINITY_DN12983_c0_g1~~TRINITY_DN12983_c0_g1_i3.p1  ORF type:complete len:556 (+),score=132.50 TRINITY_DN12983_c0_g1_i3:35-1702(+)